MQKYVTLSSPETAVNVRTVVTPGGLTAWLVESYAVPVVSLEFAMRGGAAQDPPDKAGLGMLLANLLDEGAGDLDFAGLPEGARREGGGNPLPQRPRARVRDGCARWSRTSTAPPSSSVWR